jgi:hypothetical protein
MFIVYEFTIDIHINIEFISFGYKLRRGMEGLHGSSIFSF